MIHGHASTVAGHLWPHLPLFCNTSKIATFESFVKNDNCMQFACNYWNLSENVQLHATCMQLAFFMKNCCFKFSFIFPQWALYMTLASKGGHLPKKHPKSPFPTQHLFEDTFWLRPRMIIIVLRTCTAMSSAPPKYLKWWYLTRKKFFRPFWKKKFPKKTWKPPKWQSFF